jgi:hypothetical protein
MDLIWLRSIRLYIIQFTLIPWCDTLIYRWMKVCGGVYLDQTHPSDPESRYVRWLKTCNNFLKDILCKKTQFFFNCLVSELSSQFLCSPNRYDLVQNRFCAPLRPRPYLAWAAWLIWGRWNQEPRIDVYIGSRLISNSSGLLPPPYFFVLA